MYRPNSATAPRSRVFGLFAVIALAIAGLFVGNPLPAHAGTTSDIVRIAQDNLGKGACSTNSAGTTGYYTSCTGASGQPEDWCSDFVKWVWARAGADVSGLSPWAATFAQYGPLKSTPAVGDAVLFNYNAAANRADHVAVVVAVGNGRIDTIGGNQGNGGPATNSVTRVSGLRSALGSQDSGQRIDGYVSPRGISGVGGKVFDNIRYLSEAWQGPRVADNGPVLQVAAAGAPGGDMHMLTLAGGKVFHNMRYVNGSWQGPAVADNGPVAYVAATVTPDQDMHMFTLAGGRVFHNIRHVNGSWQGPAVADNGGGVSQIAVAGTPNGDVHVFTLAGGVVFHNVRYADGSWQGARVADGGGAVSQVAAAASPNGDVHLLTLAGGVVFHNIRYAAGNWQGARVADGGGAVGQIAAAVLPNGDLHMFTLAGGKVFHNIRFAGNQLWQGARVADNGPVAQVATTSMPNYDLHLLTIA